MFSNCQIFAVRRLAGSVRDGPAVLPEGSRIFGWQPTVRVQGARTCLLVSCTDPEDAVGGGSGRNFHNERATVAALRLLTTPGPLTRVSVLHWAG